MRYPLGGALVIVALVVAGCTAPTAQEICGPGSYWRVEANKTVSYCVTQETETYTEIEVTTP